MEKLYTTQKSIIQEEVIKNLLSAHKRIAESADVAGVISFSKFLLQIADKRGNVAVNVTPKRNE